MSVGLPISENLGVRMSRVKQCYFSSENHFYFSFYLVQYQSF